MTRKIAIMVLGETRNKIYAKPLIQILEDEEDLRVVRTVIQQLGELEEKDAVNVLEKYLVTDELELKKVTILALSKLGYRKVLENLIEDKEYREKLMPESLKAIINFEDERIIDILTDVIARRREDMLDIALEGLAEFKNDKVKDIIIDFIRDKKVKREQRAKALMILSIYKDENGEKLFKEILEDNEEWWMLKKLAIVIIGEQELYSLLPEIIEYSTSLDRRISKSAKETARLFYKNFILKKLEEENSSIVDLCGYYLRIL